MDSSLLTQIVIVILSDCVSFMGITIYKQHKMILNKNRRIEELKRKYKYNNLM